MEIRCFKERYNLDFGSIFEPVYADELNKVSRFNNYKIMEPTEVFDSLGDFRDDNGYRAFESSVKVASKIICFFNDTVYPGSTSTIYQIIIQ